MFPYDIIRWTKDHFLETSYQPCCFPFRLPAWDITYLFDFPVDAGLPFPFLCSALGYPAEYCDGNIAYDVHVIPFSSLLFPTVAKHCQGLVWLLLYAHRYRRRLGATGHIILTPAKQLMVMGLKIWPLSNPDLSQRPFDHWSTSLPTALTGPTTLSKTEEI
jgi:hypothetical protein